MPSAAVELAAVTKGGAISGNVLTNDSDPDGDAIQVVGGNVGDSIAGNMAHSSSTPTAATAMLRTKARGPAHFVAQDTFAYSITDDAGGKCLALIVDRHAEPAGRKRARRDPARVHF